jgi:hypothetical protein
VPEYEPGWTGANDYAYLGDLLRTTEDHVRRSQALLKDSLELLARLRRDSSS